MHFRTDHLISLAAADLGNEIYESDDDDEDEEENDRLTSSATSSSSLAHNHLPMSQLPHSKVAGAAVTAVVRPQPPSAAAAQVSSKNSSLGSTNHIIPGLPASLTAHQAQPPHFNAATYQKGSDAKME